MTLQINAFVTAFTVPQLPSGLRTLGFVPPGRTCLKFPANWTLTIGGGDGPPTKIVWTPESLSPIYLVALDSAAWNGVVSPAGRDSIDRRLPPYDGFWGPTVSETNDFAPGSDDGWEVSFPTRSLPGDSIHSAARCP